MDFEVIVPQDLILTIFEILLKITFINFMRRLADKENIRISKLPNQFKLCLLQCIGY